MPNSGATTPTSIWDAYKTKSIDADTLDNTLLGEFKAHNDHLLQILKRKLQDGKLTSFQKILLVLGCGISAPAGLPTWDKLLNLLFSVRLEKMLLPTDVRNDLLQDPTNYAGVLDALNAQTRSEDPEKRMTPPYCGDYLEYGEYIKQACEAGFPAMAGTIFLDKTKEAMIKYHGKAFTDADIRNQTGSALGRISELMSHYQLNAITYNFDNLLEASLTIIHNTTSKCITDHKEMYTDWDLDTIKIYHVHGSFKMDGLDYGRKSDEITFAESEYEDAERYSYEWMNAVQAERIHRKDMVIVGFAAQDFNFKRILRNMNKYEDPKEANDLQAEDPAHFIFLPVEDILKDIKLPYDMLTERQMVEYGDLSAEIKNKIKKSALISPHDPNHIIEKQNYFLKAVISSYMAYKEKYLRRYRVYPIWTSYQVLPEMLQGLL